MVETDFGGDFVTIDSTQDGQIVTILGEGEYGTLTFQGKEKRVLNVPVEINGKNMIWTPGMKQGKIAQKAWGTDSKNWVGKKFEIVHMENKLLIRPIAGEVITIKGNTSQEIINDSIRTQNA